MEVVADKISNFLDSKVTKHKCDATCINYQKAFEHRERACILSDVYSVRKGELCANYEKISEVR